VDIFIVAIIAGYNQGKPTKHAKFGNKGILSLAIRTVHIKPFKNILGINGINLIGKKVYHILPFSGLIRNIISQSTISISKIEFSEKYF